jgi:hypothetical protein
VPAWLPEVHQAQIHFNKIIYLMTTGKARFFTTHGFDLRHPEVLDGALRAHPARNPVNREVVTIHGTKYEVICSMPSPDGRDPCTVSVWIIDNGQTTPRFVTAYANPMKP